MSSNSSQTLGSVDSTLSKESSSSNLSNIVNENMDNAPDKNNNPPQPGEDSYNFPPIPRNYPNNPDWAEYEKQQQIQGNTYPFLPQRTLTPYVFRDGRDYRTSDPKSNARVTFCLESQEDYVSHNPNMAYGSGSHLPQLGNNHVASSPAYTVTPSTLKKIKPSKLSSSQNRKNKMNGKSGEKVRNKSPIDSNEKWSTQELTDCDGFDPISQYRISKREKARMAATHRKNKDNTVCLFDEKDDDVDFVDSDKDKKNVSRKKKKEGKKSGDKNNEIIDVDAVGNDATLNKAKKNRESNDCSIFQVRSKKARSVGSGNVCVKAKTASLKKAPAGAICKGCNKEAEYCHDNLYSNFVVESVYDYTSTAGSQASLAGMEQAFISGYNTIHRAKEYELYDNFISENKVLTPTPCVYESSFIKVVEFYSEHINAEARRHVDAIIKRDK